jgi:hypothetical protein
MGKTTEKGEGWGNLTEDILLAGATNLAREDLPGQGF